MIVAAELIRDIRKSERARFLRMLRRAEADLLVSTGPAPGSTGATRRGIRAAFDRVRDGLKQKSNSEAK